MGSDVLCQAKSGMGKTAVFVLSILQQIKVESDETTKVAKVGALVMAHTRELAFQVNVEHLQPDIQLAQIRAQQSGQVLSVVFLLCRYPMSLDASASLWPRSLGLQSSMEVSQRRRTRKP